MTRMFVDCRDYPSESHCTVAISADSRRELIEAAAQHAVAAQTGRSCVNNWRP